MSSQAQIAANRANRQKSRGPRTVAGKARTHQNALRHGLSVLNRHNPAYFTEIERIAWAYCEGDADHRRCPGAALAGAVRRVRGHAPGRPGSRWTGTLSTARSLAPQAGDS
jgi:hypothetical protein